MDKLQSATRFLFFSVWAVFMTAVTFVLGAPPLKVLRRRLGRGLYWPLATMICVVVFLLQAKFLAISFFSLVVLVGVFEEFEDMGYSFQASAFFTLLINSLITAGGFALWVWRTGPAWKQSLLSTIEAAVKPLTELSPKLQVNPFEIMLQMPSIVLILWMGAIYLAVLLEARLSGSEASEVSSDNVEKQPTTLRAQLGEFRLPDVAVWVFIASLLGAFGNFQTPAVEAVSVNVMNVCMVMFFFQGIAVVGRFFTTVRMGMFWQVLFMTVIIVQLFLFVSLLGLLDYWLNFRSRLAKRSERFNREA